MLLAVTMALVIAVVTGLSLLLIRHRLRTQVAGDLNRDLSHSMVTFQTLEAERVGALEAGDALLAELPTLKALMTSGDDLTIQDGAAEFWHLSGTDLFMLADPSGRVIAAYGKKRARRCRAAGKHEGAAGVAGQAILIDRGSLYAMRASAALFRQRRGGHAAGVRGERRLD